MYNILYIIYISRYILHIYIYTHSIYNLTCVLYLSASYRQRKTIDYRTSKFRDDDDDAVDSVRLCLRFCCSSVGVHG